MFADLVLRLIFAVRKVGAIAQLVEHRTENPGVPGSIPGGTTAKPPKPLLDLVSSGALHFMLMGVLTKQIYNILVF